MFSKIFYGSVKLVKVEKKCAQPNNLKLKQTQIIKINIPRGFPSGGTLKSVPKNTGLDGAKSRV